jgi:hypothetical protein
MQAEADAAPIKFEAVPAGHALHPVAPSTSL